MTPEGKFGQLSPCQTRVDKLGNFSPGEPDAGVFFRLTQEPVGVIRFLGQL
jgi:hypothetical protein